MWCFLIFHKRVSLQICDPDGYRRGHACKAELSVRFRYDLENTVFEQLKNTLCSLPMVSSVAKGQAESQLTVGHLENLNVHQAGSSTPVDEFDPLGINPFYSADILHTALIADPESIVLQNRGRSDDKGVVSVVDALSGLFLHLFQQIAYGSNAIERDAHRQLNIDRRHAILVCQLISAMIKPAYQHVIFSIETVGMISGE